MLLGSPETTAYDLRFRLLDIPVRVHPLFWVVMLLISGSRDLMPAVVFVVAAFLSILVHELGHALSSRALGREPGGIVLYAMGGFCYFDGESMPPWKRVVVLLCGPGAGFLLMGLVLAFGQARYGITPADSLSMVGFGFLGGRPFHVPLLIRNPTATHLFIDLVLINLYWGIFNLFPIWPLDGGQITTTVLSAFDPRHGLRRGHVVSFLTAAGLAVWEASHGSYLSALWVGSFAFLNYQILQEMHHAYWSGGSGGWGRG